MKKLSEEVVVIGDYEYLCTSWENTEGPRHLYTNAVPDNAIFWGFLYHDEPEDGGA